MGRLHVIGESTGKKYDALYESADKTLKITDVADSIDLAQIDSTTITDASGVKLASHASRHAYGGDDAIPAGSLDVSQLKSNTIKIRVPILIPDSSQSGLAADSTGVKWTSVFKFKITKQNLKDVIVRATWTASDTDSVTEIDLIDETSGNTVASVSGNTGTDTESTNYTDANLTDEGLVHVQAQVTTASATSGATTSITYVTIELVHGAS